MTPAGWHPDPTGRFGQRWFDGNDWTDSVVGANGQLAHDPFPRELPTSSTSQWAPQPAQQAQQAQQSQSWQPAAPAPPAPQAPAQAQGWQPAAIAPATRQFPAASPAASTDADSSAIVPIIAVGMAIVLHVLSFFVLDWVGNGGDFRTIRDQFLGSGGELDFLDDLVKWFFEWLGYVVAGVVVVVAALVVLIRNASSHRLRHVVAALLAAIGAVLHAFAVVRLFRGPEDPHFWAWLGTIAYLVILAGVVISARRQPA